MVTKKLSKEIGILNRLKHAFPQNVLLSIYHSLLAFHSNSGLLLEDTHVNRVSKLQAKYFRIIFNSEYLAHSEPIFKILKLLTIDDVYNLKLIILQVNINGIKTNSRSSKCLFTTHMQISSQYRKPRSPLKQNTHNFTTVRTDSLHNGGSGLIRLIRHNIPFTTTDIPLTINAHNIELQMVKAHINKTKRITIGNIYIPPQDSTSMHYKTVDTDIQHCVQHVTYIPHSVLTEDVNAHSSLWHSYTDEHRGQLIVDVISKSVHITMNTNTPTRVPNTPTRVPNTTLQKTSLPDITTMSNTNS